MKFIPKFIRDKVSRQLTTLVSKEYQKQLGELENSLPLKDRNPKLFKQLKHLTFIPDFNQISSFLDKTPILDDKELEGIRYNLLPLSEVESSQDLKEYVQNPEDFSLILNNIIINKVEEANSAITRNEAGDSEIKFNFTEILTYLLSSLIDDNHSINEILSLHAKTKISNQDIKSKLYQHFKDNAQKELEAESLKINNLPYPLDLDKRQTLLLIEQNLTLFIKNIVFYQIQNNHENIWVNGLSKEIKQLNLKNSEDFEKNQTHILRRLSQLITYLSQQNFTNSSEKAA